MKIIIDTALGTDNVTSVTASSEDAAFPVTNVQNDFTTDLWKAASGIVSAILTIAASKGSAVELLNTNATSATVTVGSGGYYTLEAAFSLEAGFSLETDATATTTVYSLPGTAGRLWAEYSAYTTPHIIQIVLTAAATVYAGIVRAGNVEQFHDPAAKFSEAAKDYSIERELNNGADYFRKRNIVRTFSGMKIMETQANALKFKMSVWDKVGPKPLAIRLAHANVSDDEFILFAKRVSSPRLDYLTPTLTQITFDLKEVV
jgi:hypothetical protein